MFPVAYALVEAESRSSWLWFLELLNSYLQLNNKEGMTWISDKQKGVIDAITQLFPFSEHMHCVKYLHNNFKLHRKGLQLKQIF